MLSEIFILVLMFDIIGPMIDPLSPIKDPFNPMNTWKHQKSLEHNETETFRNPNSYNNDCKDIWCYIVNLFR